MFPIHWSHQKVAGVLCFICGLASECLLGMCLLNGGAWPIFFLHIPFTLLWSTGINLLTGSASQEATIPFIFLNRWGLTALLLGLGTFPGLGVSTASVALFAIHHLFCAALEEESTSASLQYFPSLLLPSEPVAIAQPLVDELYRSDLEARRRAIAKISRMANPSTLVLL